MSSYTKNMFDSIKDSLNTDTKKQGGGGFRDFLKTAAGNTYVVRLLPNITDASKTFFHYYHYGWQSVSTGQYVDILSPKTWGDKDLIETERIKLYRDKSNERAVALAKLISTKEKWLVNVLVVDDPVSPENNGTVKILRYGSQLDKIIRSAISGDDAEEYGPAIFDLSENGCNFRIKVESVKENSKSFINYTSSKFLRPSAIPNMTAERTNEVLNGVHDLASIFNRPAPAELQTMINTHLYGKEDDSAPRKAEQGFDEVVFNKEPAAKPVVKPTVKLEAPISTEGKSTDQVIAEVEARSNANVEKVVSATNSKSDDDKIKELLAGL